MQGTSELVNRLLKEAVLDNARSRARVGLSSAIATTSSMLLLSKPTIVGMNARKLAAEDQYDG
jgi:hypothetical protein